MGIGTPAAPVSQSLAASQPSLQPTDNTPVAHPAPELVVPTQITAPSSTSTQNFSSTIKANLALLKHAIDDSHRLSRTEFLNVANATKEFLGNRFDKQAWINAFDAVQNINALKAALDGSTPLSRTQFLTVANATKKLLGNRFDRQSWLNDFDAAQNISALKAALDGSTPLNRTQFLTVANATKELLGKRFNKQAWINAFDAKPSKNRAPPTNSLPSLRNSGDPPSGMPSPNGKEPKKNSQTPQLPPLRETIDGLPDSKPLLPIDKEVQQAKERARKRSHDPLQRSSYEELLAEEAGSLSVEAQLIISAELARRSVLPKQSSGGTSGQEAQSLKAQADQKPVPPEFRGAWSAMEIEQPEKAKLILLLLADTPFEPTRVLWYTAASEDRSEKKVDAIEVAAALAIDHHLTQGDKKAVTDITAIWNTFQAKKPSVIPTPAVAENSPPNSPWQHHFEMIKDDRPMCVLIRFFNEYEVKQAVQPGLALDLGAGSGRETAALSRRGWDVIAVDPDLAAPYYIRRSVKTEREKVRAAGRSTDTFGRVLISNKRAQEFTFPSNGTVDLVWSGSLSFLSKSDVSLLLEKISNCLSSKGHVVLSFFGPGHAIANDSNTWTENEVKQLLEAHGLEVLELAQYTRTAQFTDRVGTSVLVQVVAHKKTP